MIYRDLLTNELHRQRDDFLRFAASQNEELSIYETLVSEMSTLSVAEILVRLEDSTNFGALPSEEIQTADGIRFEFNEAWTNHEEARTWAGKVLANRTTFAVDGSQVYAEKETSLPVGAIQIGWFENPHNKDLPYEKNADFKLLTPNELMKDHLGSIDPESRVGEQRFHAEVKCVSNFLKSRRDWRESGDRMPLVFIDGTLLISFSLPQTDLQKSYISAMVELVELSRETGVPIVGYIDRSFSRDLLNLLDSFSGRDGAAGCSLVDTSLLEGTGTNSGLLGSWGERTCFFFAKRKGMGAFDDTRTGKPLVGFSYLKTAANSPPARLDIPTWVHEAALLDDVIDVIRAECVIGLGYPYPLETADEAALISNRDRQVFLRALQEFAVREKLNFSVTRKNASKRRRR